MGRQIVRAQNAPKRRLWAVAAVFMLAGASGAQAACDAKLSNILMGAIRPSVEALEACGGPLAGNRTERVDVQSAFFCPGGRASSVKASITVACRQPVNAADQWPKSQTFDVSATLSNHDCQIRRYAFRPHGVGSDAFPLRQGFSKQVYRAIQRELTARCR